MTQLITNLRRVLTYFGIMNDFLHFKQGFRGIYNDLIQLARNQFFVTPILQAIFMGGVHPCLPKPCIKQTPIISWFASGKSTLTNRAAIEKYISLTRQFREIYLYRSVGLGTSTVDTRWDKECAENWILLLSEGLQPKQCKTSYFTDNEFEF